MCVRALSLNIVCVLSSSSTNSEHETECHAHQNSQLTDRRGKRVRVSTLWRSASVMVKGGGGMQAIAKEGPAIFDVGIVTLDMIADMQRRQSKQTRHAKVPACSIVLIVLLFGFLVFVGSVYSTRMLTSPMDRRLETLRCSRPIHALPFFRRG